MKNLLIINLFLFTSSSKKLIFVFILLLILLFSGCKSVVKETVNGDVYVGLIVSGQLHGQGTYTFPDGRKYVGEWKYGKLHGQGEFTWSNGDKYEGEWKDGKIWKGITYDKNGNIKYKYVYGKEIEQ